MISSLEAVRAINRERGNAIIVNTMTPFRYLEAVSDRPDLDLPIFGAMGKASSVALGLALARPDQRIVVLDGDGSLLMNLGSLVTTAGAAPENFVHILFEDTVYFTTGSQPVPGAGQVDFGGMAKDAGFAASCSFDDLEDLASELPAIMEQTGPVFVCLKVNHPEEPPPFHVHDTAGEMRRLASQLADE